MERDLLDLENTATRCGENKENTLPNNLIVSSGNLQKSKQMRFQKISAKPHFSLHLKDIAEMEINSHGFEKFSYGWIRLKRKEKNPHDS